MDEEEVVTRQEDLIPWWNDVTRQEDLIPWWNDEGCYVYSYDPEVGDEDEELEEAGFKLKIKEGDEYIYYIRMYENTKDEIYIIYLWNQTTGIFTFACKNRREAFTCFKEMLSTCRELINLNIYMKELDEKY